MKGVNTTLASSSANNSTCVHRTALTATAVVSSVAAKIQPQPPDAMTQKERVQVSNKLLDLQFLYHIHSSQLSNSQQLHKSQETDSRSTAKRNSTD
jgi:hypothetical protein